MNEMPMRKHCAHTRKYIGTRPNVIYSRYGRDRLYKRAFYLTFIFLNPLLSPKAFLNCLLSFFNDYEQLLKSLVAVRERMRIQNMPKLLNYPIARKYNINHWKDMIS